MLSTVGIKSIAMIKQKFHFNIMFLKKMLLLVFIIASCNKTETLDATQEKSISQPIWIEQIKNYCSGENEIIIDNINEILEKSDCKCELSDGGSETGVTFYEILVICGNEKYYIDISGQINSDSKKFILHNLDIYLGDEISDDKLVYKWFSVMK